MASGRRRKYVGSGQKGQTRVDFSRCCRVTLAFPLSLEPIKGPSIAQVLFCNLDICCAFCFFLFLRPVGHKDRSILIALSDKRGKTAVKPADVSRLRALKQIREGGGQKTARKAPSLGVSKQGQKGQAGLPEEGIPQLWGQH